MPCLRHEAVAFRCRLDGEGSVPLLPEVFDKLHIGTE